MSSSSPPWVHAGGGCRGAGLPTLPGWSPDVRRWLAQHLEPAPTIDWLQDKPSPLHRLLVGQAAPGAARSAPLAVRSVTIDDMRPVLSHRIERRLDRCVHVLRFIGGAELHYAFDHRGVVTELVSRGLRAARSGAQAVVFSLDAARRE